MKLLVVLSLAAVAVILPQVHGQGTGPITRASNAFANRLFQQLAKKPGNILVCPVSLHVALALLHQGAGGNTAIELAKTLGLTGTNEDIKTSYLSVLNSIQDNTLKVATKLYPADDVKLNQKYVSDAKQYFLSGVETLDFKNANTAADKMNKFVQEATNDKIRNLISPDSLSEFTRLVIINAVHFQASWKNIFPTSYEGIFKVNKQQKVKTKMMSQTETFGYKEDLQLDAKILKMDYDVEGYSMLIVLPNKEEGLTEVELRLQNTSLTSLMKGLNPTRVEVTIPKFTMEQTMDLKDILKQMGLTQIFVPRADLSNVAEAEHLFVSKVVQKTFINVHENGTEAAAATVVLETLSAIKDDIIFYCSRPFHFYLVHDTSPLAVFEGRFVEPQTTDRVQVTESDVEDNSEALVFNNDYEEDNKPPRIPVKPTRKPTQEPNRDQRPLDTNGQTDDIPDRNTFESETPQENINQNQETDPKPVTEDKNENTRLEANETIKEEQTVNEQEQPFNNYTLNDQPDQNEKRKGNFITNAIKKIINFFN